MARPKKEIYIRRIMSKKELLDYRIDYKSDYGIRKGRATEEKFQKELHKELTNILTEVGFNVISINREFKLFNGRCDFLCKLENGQYLIIECKVAEKQKYHNKDLLFSFAVGQLLSYRTSLSQQYDIDRDNIKLMLITNEDSLFTLSMLATEKLDIDYMVYHQGEVKYYGQKKW